MRASHKINTVFDDPNLMSAAGLVPLMRLAESAGLHKLMDAMVEAMLSGWRAQQSARGLRAETIAPASGWCAGSWRSPTDSRGSGLLDTWMSGR